MFYRYEAYCEGKWIGICGAMTPSHRRKMGRFLSEPKWYAKNPGVDSRCWFTQYGYDRHHKQMEAIIEDYLTLNENVKIRLLKSEVPGRIVMLGKIQCICLGEDRQGKEKK